MKNKLTKKEVLAQAFGEESKVKACKEQGK